MGEKITCPHAAIVDEWAKAEQNNVKGRLFEKYPNMNAVQKRVGVPLEMKRHDILNRAAIDACGVCTSKYVLKPGKTEADCPNKDEAKEKQTKLAWIKANGDK